MTEMIKMNDLYSFYFAFVIIFSQKTIYFSIKDIYFINNMS